MIDVQTVAFALPDVQPEWTPGKRRNWRGDILPPWIEPEVVSRAKTNASSGDEWSLDPKTFVPDWFQKSSAPIMPPELIAALKQDEVIRQRAAYHEAHKGARNMTKTVGDVNPFATVSAPLDTPLASTTHRLGTTPERAADEQLPNWFQRDENDKPVEDDEYLTMFMKGAKPVETTKPVGTNGQAALGDASAEPPDDAPVHWVNDDGQRGKFFTRWNGICAHYNVPQDVREINRKAYLKEMTGVDSLKGWTYSMEELLNQLEHFVKVDYPLHENKPVEAAPVETPPTTPENRVSSRGDVPGATAGHSESKALALTTSIDYETGEIIAFDPNRAITTTKAKSALVNRLVQDDVLVKGVDYGAVPGTDKNTLLKPGAEKLLTAFQLHDVFVDREIVRDWNAGFFFYEYECVLTDRETGKPIGTGIGSCNSMEKKYRFRWVTKDRVPKALNLDSLTSKGGKISEFDFAVEKAETTGKYGKPAEYWKQFRDALANGTAVVIKRKDSKGVERSAIEIDSTMYGIPNEDIFDLVNTISKMAQKRALVAAVLNATGASAVFTQDLEDFTDFGMIEAA